MIILFFDHRSQTCLQLLHKVFLHEYAIKNMLGLKGIFVFKILCSFVITLLRVYFLKLLQTYFHNEQDDTFVDSFKAMLIHALQFFVDRPLVCQDKVFNLTQVFLIMNLAFFACMVAVQESEKNLSEELYETKLTILARLIVNSKLNKAGD